MNQKDIVFSSDLPSSASQAIPAAALMLFYPVTTATLSYPWRFSHPFLTNGESLSFHFALLYAAFVLGEDGMLVPAIRYFTNGPGMD